MNNYEVSDGRIKERFEVELEKRTLAVEPEYEDFRGWLEYSETLDITELTEDETIELCEEFLEGFTAEAIKRKMLAQYLKETSHINKKVSDNDVEKFNGAFFIDYTAEQLIDYFKSCGDTNEEAIRVFESDCHEVDYGFIQDMGF